MKVWLDIRPVAHPGVGVGIYTTQLARQLGELDLDLVLDYASLRRRNELPSLNGTPVRFGSPLRWMIGKAWERGLARPALESFVGPVEVAHGTNYECPPTKFAARVATVHDLTSVIHPEWHTKFVQRLGARLLAQLPRLHRVITVSQSTADDVMRLAGVPASRISVTHLAPADGFIPIPEEERAAVLREFGLEDRRYVLHVGSLEPRKNLVRLVGAFAKAATPDVRLVLAAAASWSSDELFARIESAEIADRVTLTGYVPPEQLPALYSGARVVAYPSLYEGFGLPVIEALACGAPVLTSNRTSLPEVAGDAAVLVDPEDEDTIAAELRRLLTDDSARAQLREAGLVRAASFTWGETAAATLDAYQAAA